MPSHLLSLDNPRSLSATATSNRLSDFVETLEYRRFAEFCETCRQYRYIGLCFGAPGVGKTLSARRISQADRVENHDLWQDEPIYGLPIETAFYTTPVVNTPSQIATDIHQKTQKLSALARGPISRQAELALDTIRLRNENYRRAHERESGYKPFEEPPLEPTYRQVLEHYESKRQEIGEATTLVLVDEADRLRMNSLEQVRSLFDASHFGLVLIGMPGIEKRMARYPQFYSRIGFVHEFRPIATAEVRRLLDRRWRPLGVKLPDLLLAEEAAAAIIRITGGNFRLLNRLLTQIERILEINGLREISPDVVQAARESLVIGQV
jgi:DNA transposition AAA+ family ATPase